MLIRWKLVVRGQPVDEPTEESYHPFAPGQVKPLFSAPPYYYGVLPEISHSYSDDEIAQAQAVLQFFNDQQKVFQPGGAGLSLEEIEYINDEAKGLAPLLGSDVYSKAMEIDCAVRDIQTQENSYNALKQNGVVEELSDADWAAGANAALPSIREELMNDVNAAYFDSKNSAQTELDFEIKAEMLIHKNQHFDAIQAFQFSSADPEIIIQELNDFRSRPLDF